MNAYTVTALLPMQPNPGVWTRLEIRRIRTDSVPAESNDTRRFATYPQAVLFAKGFLAVATAIAAIDQDIAADDALRLSAGHGPDAHVECARAVQAYHLARWRAAQIAAIQHQLARTSPPRHTRTRRVSVAPHTMQFSRAYAA